MSMWDDLKNLGAAAIKREAQARLQVRGTSAHIAAQNDAGADFSVILAEHQAGRLNTAQAIAEIDRIAAQFELFAGALGYERAIRGARDVNAVAAQIRAGLRSVSLPPVVSGPGVIDIPGIGAVGVGTLALVGIGAYLFLRRR